MASPKRASLPADVRELLDQLEEAERDAVALVAGLSDEQGAARAEERSWSVAECLDHLATANRVYLRAMQEPARLARARGRQRRRPAFLASQADVRAFASACAQEWIREATRPVEVLPRTCVGSSRVCRRPRSAA
jgi:uncharacterized damage-inducible protein DinB